MAEIGILSQPIDKLTIGIHVFNPWQAELAEYQDETIPSVYRIGLAYSFSDEVLMTAELEKDLLYPSVFKSGIEYYIIPKIALRIGVQNRPAQFTFGLGTVFDGFKADLAFSYHQILGASSQIAIAYQFKSK